jgi:hypothetical protein
VSAALQQLILASSRTGRPAGAPPSPAPSRLSARNNPMQLSGACVRLLCHGGGAASLLAAASALLVSPEQPAAAVPETDDPRALRARLHSAQRLMALLDAVAAEIRAPAAPVCLCLALTHGRDMQRRRSRCLQPVRCWLQCTRLPLPWPRPHRPRPACASTCGPPLASVRFVSHAFAPPRSCWKRACV